MKRIGVLGAGTWGIALARMLSNKGHSVTVWSALPAEVEGLARTHIHKNLPGVILPDKLKFTKSIKTACNNKDVIVFAVPSVYVRSTAKTAGPYIKEGQLVVSVAKGLEPKTLLTMTEVIEQELNAKVRLVALSGPTHAEEVARDMPTMIVAASPDQNASAEAAKIFKSKFLRVYTNTDIKGVEICGAFKNIIALAAGISSGLGFGDNARAAIITRGIHEMTRLGNAMGCSPNTFSGLTGIGDLVVTATSVHSRNNRAGFLIGQGATAEQAVIQVGMVVEGLNALEGAMEFSKKYNVEMPIVNAVNEIVNNGKTAKQMAKALLRRLNKDETIF